MVVTMDNLEDQLIGIIRDEHDTYISRCDIKNDIDVMLFAHETREVIEGRFGDRFDNYSIESYCISYYEVEEEEEEDHE
jgi:hypothetical protein